MNQTITAENAPAAVGPYSHAVRAGKTLYISGQLGLDPQTGELAESVEAQAEQALKNLGEILRTGGMSYPDVVKTTVFLTSMSDFAAINGIYGRYFEKNPPARSCVAVSELPKGGKFEVEAVAVKE